MKRLLLPLLALLSLLWLTSAMASTAYELDTENGILRITGTGAMTNYSQAGAPWYRSRAKIRQIVIGDGVTAIGSNAFYLLTAAETAVVPGSVTIIGRGAFAKCKQLTVTLPEHVSEIGSDAFTGTSLVLCEPRTETSAALSGLGYAFASPAQPELLLTEINGSVHAVSWQGGDTPLILPDYVSAWTDGHASVVRLPSTMNADTVFSLTAHAVVIPAGVTSAGTLTLSDTDVLYIPGSVTDLSGISFTGHTPVICCGQSSVAAAWGKENSYTVCKVDLSRIHHAANGQCIICCKQLDLSGLEALILPEDTVEIGEEAFGRTSAGIAVIPDGCSSVAPRAFAGCASLRYIQLSATLAGTLPSSALQGSAAELIIR